MKHICKHCNEEKEYTSFQKHSKTKLGIILTCNDCYYKKRKQRRTDPIYRAHEAELKKKYYIEKKNDIGRYSNYLSNKKKYREDNKAKYLFLKARSRAAELNLDFDLDESDIVIPKTCPILGIELLLEENSKNLYSPTIDRIIPELGYVKGNIAVISKKANMMKSNATIEELTSFVTNILNYVKTTKNKKEISDKVEANDPFTPPNTRRA